MSVPSSADLGGNSRYNALAFAPAPLPRYRIGLLMESGIAPETYSGLAVAADRLNFSIFVAKNAAELNSGKVDFALTDLTIAQRPAGVPTFAVLRSAKPEFWEDPQWIGQLAGYDGFLTASDRVRRFLQRFRFDDGRIPCIGSFEVTPERQFLTAKLKNLVQLGALRLCHVAAADDTCDSPALDVLSARPYFRRYGHEPIDAASGETGDSQSLPIGSQPAQHLFAAFGAGLVLPSPNAADVASLHRLCQIISVGAVALCPDTPWIRQYFAETVCYFPEEDPIAAAQAIDAAMEQIAGDAAGAAARASAARAIFEERFAAEIMLQNAVVVFEEWRARASRAAASARPSGTVVNTDAAAIESVFARLPAKALADVGRAVAQLNPLQPMPHWRFAGFEESPDLAVHVRHSLWRAGKARGGAGPVVMPWHGGTRLNLYLDNDLSLTLFSGGSFEPNEFALLDRILRPGMVFVDGGANEGAYTVFAAVRVGPKGQVIAIEPSERELERLKANIALNRLRNVDIVEMALADRSGSARLLIAEPEHAGQNTLGEFAYAIKCSGALEVATTTLDELIEARGLDRLDVLKLDIEGAEFRALSAAWGVLEEMRPLILFEVTEAALEHQGASAAAVFELLKAANYVVLRIDEETGEPGPFASGRDTPSDNMVAVHAERDWGLAQGSD